MEETNKEKTEPKEHKKPWQETYAKPEEIKAFLSDHIYLRQNVVTGRTEHLTGGQSPCEI